MVILCPNCQHHEIAGALFCSECGTQLVFTERLSTQAISRSQTDGLIAQGLSSNEDSLLTPPAVSVDSMVSLSLVENGQVIPLSGRLEFTLGRVADGQPILPDVDLSSYSAYSQGVSRLHAALKISSQQIMVMDLGSTNGTRVNGQKIMANIDYPINHGDVIALGKLKVQVLIKR